MAAHSRILTWKMPRTEELGGLQFMVLQRVGHDLVHAHTHTHTHTHTHKDLLFSTGNSTQYCSGLYGKRT